MWPVPCPPPPRKSGYRHIDGPPHPQTPVRNASFRRVSRVFSTVVPTSSGQSKNRAKSKITAPLAVDASQAARLSGFRGKPSMRKRDFPELAMALRRSPTVTSAGTILPSLDKGGVFRAVFQSQTTAVCRAMMGFAFLSYCGSQARFCAFVVGGGWVAGKGRGGAHCHTEMIVMCEKHETLIVR